MRRLVIFETSKLALSALFVISALLLGWAVQGLVLATTLVNAGYALASVVLYRRLAQSDTRFPTWLELFSRMWSVDVKRWFRLGFYIALQKNLDALSEHVLMMLFGTMGVDFTGRISVALKIVTLPQPLISGIARNLDSFLPKRVGQNESNLLRVFTQTTLYTAAIWSLVTLGMAIAGPVLLIVLFPEQADVVPLLYPLLIQSIAIGFGVGIGPTMRTIGRVEYLIVIHSIIVALTIPVGTWLIRSMGLYGAAWLVGLQQSIETALMLGIVFWLLRRRVRAAS